MSEAPDPDWKAIAEALARRVEFAIRHMVPGHGATGTVFTLGDKTEIKDRQSWQDYFADALEMMPGLKVDREVAHAFQLPRRERNKWFKKNRPEKPETRKAASDG
jgi:hypothetical protein